MLQLQHRLALRNRWFALTLTTNACTLSSKSLAPMYLWEHASATSRVRPKRFCEPGPHDQAEIIFTQELRATRKPAAARDYETFVLRSWNHR